MYEWVNEWRNEWMTETTAAPDKGLVSADVVADSSEWVSEWVSTHLHEPPAQALVVHGGHVAGAAAGPDERLVSAAVVADPAVADWTHAADEGVRFHILVGKKQFILVNMSKNLAPGLLYKLQE